MCGRYTLATPDEVIAELFDLPEPPCLAPRWNIAPTQPVAVVRTGDTGERELASLHWGLIPSWAKERSIGARMINARAETVADKPAFRSALRARRCLIVADGFFEWQKAGPRKQPHYVRMRDWRPFAFAGLWERWAPGQEQPVESCVIVTTTPNEVLAPIHDRMPVILAAADFARWLDPETRDAAAALTLLRPYPAEELEAYPVGLRVNNPANDDPACIVPLC
jgi:putative SOS response-associated peptidase YedK